mgnify:CR=1 FL=1
MKIIFRDPKREFQDLGRAMVKFKRIHAVSLGAALVLTSGCANTLHVREQAIPTPLWPQWARFTKPGEYSVQVETGHQRSAHGCDLTYTHYRPEANRQTSVPVILAHGFLRQRHHMAGWGRHWASHGLATITVDLCNMTWWNAHHHRNGADLQALAAVFADGPRIYAGFSAGAMAALLAASKDPHTRAILALDPVLAARHDEALQALRRPRLLLLGTASPCNAHHAGLTRLARAADAGLARVLRIPMASHCQFEWPQGGLCRRLCGGVEPAQAARRIEASIRALATVWLLQHARPWPVRDPPRTGLADPFSDLLDDLKQTGRIQPWQGSAE